MPVNSAAVAHVMRMTKSYSEAVDQLIAARHQRYVYPTEAVTETVLAPSIIHRHFTVANEAVGLQLPAWRDYVGRTLDVPISRTQLATGFRGEISSYILKDMVYLDSRTDAVSQARTAAGISTDTTRDFVFHVAVDGIVETVTGTHRSRKAEQFVPGVLALDMNQQMRMSRPGPARVLAFFLPRAMVEAVIPDAESIHGQVLGYTSPLTRLLREHLGLLCRSLSTMNAADAEHTVRTCANLLVAAFGNHARLSGGARAATRAAMLDQVKRYVQANLHHEKLSPEGILQAFGLPRPTLYRMFESEGGLGTYIRHCRLREAAGDLVRFPHVSVAEIGYGLDFNSHSDFTRAFRGAFGMSPQDFRAFGLDFTRE
jgi:AraC-like DNA-binding protein